MDTGLPDMELDAWPCFFTVHSPELLTLSPGHSCWKSYRRGGLRSGVDGLRHCFQRRRQGGSTDQASQRGVTRRLTFTNAVFFFLRRRLTTRISLSRKRVQAKQQTR
jgi:hypothetical protein